MFNFLRNFICSFFGLVTIEEAIRWQHSARADGRREGRWDKEMQKGKLDFKPFFIHEQFQKWERAVCNGITFYVKPSEEEGMVEIRIAQCSRKDQYCKATGRAVAQAAEHMLVPVREVGKTLAILYYNCFKDKPEPCLQKYDYIYKYMI